MLEELVAQRIKDIVLYKVDESNRMLRLDRNESPWEDKQDFREFIIGFLEKAELGLYPDDRCMELLEAISSYAGIDTGSILVGNGSDQLIQLIMEAFIDEGDRIAVHTPTFTMYEFYAKLCGGQIAAFESNEDFQVDIDKYIEFIKKMQPKLAIICSPNNPTGQSFEAYEIKRLLQSFSGLVMVDEAYFEFSKSTVQDLLMEYKNLIILRTLSKAFGMGGLRVGYCMADRSTIGLLKRARPPFNLNTFSQAAAAWALDKRDCLKMNVDKIIRERDRMRKILGKTEGVKCYPAYGNFILLELTRKNEAFEALKARGILVKQFEKGRLGNCLRITIGKREINDIVIQTIQEVMDFE